MGRPLGRRPSRVVGHPAARALRGQAHTPPDAERVCAAGLAASRDAGDLFNEPALLSLMVLLELWAGRVDEAAAHLREAFQISLRAGDWFGDYLEDCGYLCAATGATPRPSRRGLHMPRFFRVGTGPGTYGCGKNRYAQAGRRWDLIGRGRPRNAARR